MIEPHLQLRGNTYYFRIAIPKNLAPIVGFTEYKKSLRTKDYMVARRKSRIMSHVAEELFEIIQEMTKTKAQDEIQQVARNHFEKCLLDASEELIFERDIVRDDPVEGGFNPQILIRLTEKSNNRLMLLKQSKTQHTYGPEQEKVANDLIKAKQIDIGNAQEKYHALCHAILRAQHEAERIRYAYLSGNEQDGMITDPYFKDCKNFFETPDANLFFANEDHPYYTDPTKLTLREAVEKYLSFEIKNGITERNLKSKTAYLERMLEFLGDSTPLSSIQPQPHGANLRDMVFRLPKNYIQKYKNKGIELHKALESDNNDKIEKKTQGLYWGAYCSFFKWLKNDKLIHSNPLEDLNFKYKKKNVRGDRLPFSKEQLETLFTSAIYKGRKNEIKELWKQGELMFKDGYFWLPLIGLFTGMRLGEILQLLPEDIKQDEKSTWYFDVNDNDERKHLKTENSKRKIPIHPELLKMGFIEYCKKREDICKRHNRFLLEDNITYQKNDMIKNYSRQFSTYLKKHDIKDKKIVFHSFRHNFVDQIRHIPFITDEIMDALDGREAGTAKSYSTRLSYGTPLLATKLNEYLEQVDYGIDLSHLYIDD
ncbi:MAG: site-specific integrase [Alphaproteobacteria bacterium]|nr:site-specific integrase [Alphaproteobacteria bacterium]